MQVIDVLRYVKDILWGWPLLGFFAFVGVALTLSLNFIQFRKFFSSWKLIFGSNQNDSSKGDMSPFGAFLNTLSCSIGNGGLVGMAAAIHTGGPGAAFWIFFIGLFGMVIRFAEVFLAVSFFAQEKEKGALGGPFLYIKALPFGTILVTAYATILLIFGLVGGNAMQCNSIATAFYAAFGVAPWIVGIVLTILVSYILLGGSERIVKASGIIIPFKVGLFFLSISFVLFYHRYEIIPALYLIVKAAFYPGAVMGAAAGVTIQSVIRASVARTINASEAGIGTAALFYGSTGSKDATNDGLSSMLTIFVGNNIVLCLAALAIVASGAWKMDLNGALLTSYAFSTALGSLGAVIVSILSIIFGIGVFVPYGYITRQCWIYLTGGRWMNAFVAIFCAVAFIGSVSEIDLVWESVDITLAGCIIINMIALLYLIPYMRKNIIFNS